MKQHAHDFLVEIHTEELPPKSLLGLATAFSNEMTERLQKTGLTFNEVTYFAAPRRLAVLVTALSSATADQLVERKGPAASAAFTAEGAPTPACVGFARSCGVEVSALKRLATPQGEWMAYTQSVPGKTVQELIPAIVTQALAALPIPKRMRWGDGVVEFVRPVHAVVLLYGKDVIEADILGCQTGRKTRGHRFHAPGWISIPSASQYEDVLENKAHVIARFEKRKDMIQAQLKGALVSSEAFLNEVTGLIEWPYALRGQFDPAYLALPSEVLISAMQDHQRYFPVLDANGRLLPAFVTISHIESNDVERVVRGNERVLRARLSDAAFFYETDKKESLEQRLERLRGIVFQAKLGTLYDKAERLSKLSAYIAEKMNVDVTLAARAGWLAKTDLTTYMVGEFPELQGIMGGYYALHDGETKEIAAAMREQYLPRFAKDTLPQQSIGQVLALADRIDTLVGSFGISHIPTGDKDPYGLRRAALGVLRILIENKIDLDMSAVIEAAMSYYQMPLENKALREQVLSFIQERLRAWYQDQQISADVFAAVAALNVTNPCDVDARIQAVQRFKQLSAAESLSVANKRVSNILAKYVDAIDATAIDPAFFEDASEQALLLALETKTNEIERLSQSGDYSAVLLHLADLNKPVDDFFERVMVITDDKSRRENRLLMLTKLRALFLQVADIALLQ